MEEVFFLNSQKIGMGGYEVTMNMGIKERLKLCELGVKMYEGIAEASKNPK